MVSLWACSLHVQGENDYYFKIHVIMFRFLFFQSVVRVVQEKGLFVQIGEILSRDFVSRDTISLDRFGWWKFDCN